VPSLTPTREKDFGWVRDKHAAIRFARRKSVGDFTQIAIQDEGCEPVHEELTDADLRR